MKRIISRSVMLVMGAGALALMAFGPKPTTSGKQDRVHIQYWEKWTGLEAQQAQQVVDAFNNTVGAQKGIFVDYVSMSQIDRKSLVATAAGAPPDLVGIWDRQVLEFASKGALEPLDEQTRAAGLTRDRYKPVYYEGCEYKGHLYALPSTGWCVAMMWNKQVFADHAQQLRAAGLDSNKVPTTLAELDRYAAALDTWQNRGGNKHLEIAGCVPLEPGSFTDEMPFWFGAPMSNPDGTRVEFTSPQMVNCYDWVRSYSQRIGKDALAEFRSGFNAGSTSIFDTPQNPFLMGWIAMEQQGTWMAAFIEKLAPQLNRWHVPADQLQRERDFDRVQMGMSVADVQRLLGSGAPVIEAGQTRASFDYKAASAGAAVRLQWPAGIKRITVTFMNGHVTEKRAKLLSAKDRQQFCQWGAAAWPTDVPGLNNVTYAGTDVWVIPSTAHHKKEAFEFLAFASRQDQIEKLSSLHCNLSPLSHASQEYLDNHPNPYVDVYEMLAASPNARPLPPLVNWPQLEDELTQAAERSYMEVDTTAAILNELQSRSQRELNKSLGVDDEANLSAPTSQPMSNANSRDERMVAVTRASGPCWLRSTLSVSKFAESGARTHEPAARVTAAPREFSASPTGGNYQ